METKSPPDLNERTKRFAVSVFNLCNRLPFSTQNKTISNQLMRSSSSVAANYRASKRAKSKKDFIYKISVVEEEADESLFWLEFLLEFDPKEKEETKGLIKEASELTAIFTSIGRKLKQVPTN